MRDIKFRGKPFSGGHKPCFGSKPNKLRGIEYVYGYLVRLNGHTYIYDISRRENIEVDPVSVAQLAYVDENGVEYYEGDVLTQVHNGVRYEYKVKLIACAVAEDGCYIAAEQFRDMEKKS